MIIFRVVAWRLSAWSRLPQMQRCCCKNIEARVPESFTSDMFPWVRRRHFSCRKPTVSRPITWWPPLEGETVVTKNYPNSFRDTILLEILKKENITDLLFCGAMSHMCIDATVRAGFDLGFNCVVAEDACATRDLCFNDTTIPASAVHASFMAALSGTYAAVLSTEQILQKMKYRSRGFIPEAK